MLRIAALFILLLCASPVYADQLDGLAVLGIIIPALLIGSISFIILLIATIIRFSNSNPSPSILVNVSGAVFIGTIVVMLFALGFDDLDGGFLTFCVSVGSIAGFIMYLNNALHTFKLENLELRKTVSEDLSDLFRFQTDPDAIWMAAFTPDNPNDKETYLEKWGRIIQNPNIDMYTFLVKNKVVGSIVHFEMFGEINISYWIDRPYWGKGIATQGLKMFLTKTEKRPLYGRTAFDNKGSQRVLEKCGFTQVKTEKAFANARKGEILEYIYILR